MGIEQHLVPRDVACALKQHVAFPDQFAVHTCKDTRQGYAIGVRLITLSDATRLLRTNEQTILEWARQGYLRVYLIGADDGAPMATHCAVSPQSLRFDADEVDELVEDLSWSRLGRQHLWEDED